MDHKENWEPKNLCFWNVVLEKTLERHLGCKEIKSVNPKGYQFWILKKKNKEPTCQCRRHETQVQSLGQEDSLEEGIATYPSILAWRIPWTEEPGGLWSTVSQRVRHNWSNLVYTHHINELERGKGVRSFAWMQQKRGVYKLNIQWWFLKNNNKECFKIGMEEIFLIQIKGIGGRKANN